ncbi:MAG: tetratricopeptide repeat protein [bacterium]|nr:tetratricopeptide repeat protein [bacterium]
MSIRSTPLFNLAVGYRNRGNYAEAIESLDKAIKKEGNRAPILTLKAICMMALDMNDEGRDLLKDALLIYGPLELLTDWELGWCYTAANLFGDSEKMEKVEWMRNKRREGKDKSPVTDDEVLRPAIRKEMKH